MDEPDDPGDAPATAPHDERGQRPQPGPQALSTFPLSRLAPVHELVDLLAQLERAELMVSVAAQTKLETIARQVEFLRQQAVEALAQAEHDVRLHRAECRIQKRPGQVLHLYVRPDGRELLSLVAPRDWAGRAPGTPAGSFRLEIDQSWTPIDPADPGRTPAPGRSTLPALKGA